MIDFQGFVAMSEHYTATADESGVIDQADQLRTQHLCCRVFAAWRRRQRNVAEAKARKPDVDAINAKPDVAGNTNKDVETPPGVRALTNAEQQAVDFLRLRRDEAKREFDTSGDPAWEAQQVLMERALDSFQPNEL